MKEENFPHTRKLPHWRGWGRGKLRSHRRERSSKGAEGKAERIPHRGAVLTSTHQPERLSAHPLGWVGAGC